MSDFLPLLSPRTPRTPRSGGRSATSIISTSGKTAILLRDDEGEDPHVRTMRKAREIVAVVRFMCSHEPDAKKTPLLLDRLCFCVELCLSDGLKTVLGTMFGRSPLHSMMTESHNVVPLAQRELMERMLKLANKIGTSNTGRARVFIRLLFNNKIMSVWLDALLNAPFFLEFVVASLTVFFLSFFSCFCFFAAGLIT